MALYSGIVPPERLAATRAWFVAHFRNPGASLVVGLKKNYRELLDQRAGLGMPIMFYWAFTEIYKMDTAEAAHLALSQTRERWANMVRFLQDVGTLSESFVNDQGGGMSESCHNYGSIPAYFLSSYLLGVRIEESLAHKRIVINPRPADLAKASGSVVTPFGPVPVAWQIHEGEWKLRFTVPDGISAEIRLPDVDAATLNWNDGVQGNPLVAGRNTVIMLGSGTHELRVKTKHRPSTAPK
jgi:hypothetical protein